MTHYKRLRLLYSALTTAPGGGLTATTGLLSGIAECAQHAQVLVICCSDSIAASIRALGARIHVLRCSSDIGSIQRLAIQTLFLARIVRQLRIDYVITHNTPALFVNCKRIVIHHNILVFQPCSLMLQCFSFQPRSLMLQCFSNGIRYAFLALLAKLTRSVSHANLYVSQHLRAAARDSRPLSKVMPLAFRQAFARPADEIKRHANRVLIVTSDTWYKRNDIALQVLIELRKRQPLHAWTLRVAGIASDSHFARQCKAMNIMDHVVLLGHISQALLKTEYQSATVLLNCSERESFCLPLIEAMASCCTVITADVPPFREVTLGLAELLPDMVPAHVADVIIRIARDDPQHLNATSTAERIAKYYSWQASARTLLSVMR